LEIIITPLHTFTLGSRDKGEGETKANQEYQYRKVGFERSSREISSNVKMNSTAFFCMLPDRRT
jgi:hypothetical protein